MTYSASSAYDPLDTKVQVMLDWLNATDQSPRFKSAIEKRHDSTGSWLLAQDVYINWRSAPGSFWVHGIRKFVCCRFQDLELTNEQSWLWKDYPLVLYSTEIIG